MASFKKVHLDLVEQFMDNTGGIFTTPKEVSIYASKEALKASPAFNQAFSSDPDLNGTGVYDAFCAVVFTSLEQLPLDEKKAFISRAIKAFSLDTEQASILDLVKTTTRQYEQGRIDSSSFVQDIESHMASYKQSREQEELFINEMVERVLKDVEKEGFNNLLFGNLDYLSEVAFSIKIERVKAG